MGSDTNVAVHVNSTGKRAIDFPLDVLINIFELVYAESREPFVSVKTKHRPLFSWEETRTCWKDEDPLSPTFFPEALAAVCPSWREALSQISVFWTRIVIVVDDEPTPLSTVRTSLALSEPHFIDNIICRRHDHDLNSTAAERAYIDAVMALLDPHKQRWGSLHIDLRTSLESPSPITLNGDAHSLVALNIDSTEDANIQHSPGFCFHAPQLLKLHMGGLAFSRHYLARPKVISSLKSLSLIQRIHHGPIFGVDELVRCLSHLPRLKTLELAHLDLLPALRASGPRGSQLAYCGYTGFPGDILCTLLICLRYANNCELYLTQCEIPREVDRLKLFSLQLEEMQGDSEALRTLLSACSASLLTVIECPSFDTRLLHYLSVADDRDRWLWLCASMSELAVRGCHGFTSGDIANMINARDEEVALQEYYLDFVGRDPPQNLEPIVSMRVDDGTELHECDKQSFRKSEVYVSWDAWCDFPEQFS